MGKRDPVTPFDKLRERYLNDATTRAVVDTMHRMLDDLHVDPRELRDLAVFAAVMHSERCMVPMLLMPQRAECRMKHGRDEVCIDCEWR